MDDGFFFPFLPQWLDMLLSMVSIILVPVAVIVVLVGMWRKVFNVLRYVFTLQPLRRRQKRQQLQQGLEYYRDLPANGNLKASPDTARQVLGLRKFLLDFSLIDVRRISELPLWREYLVYATLFGIADQVSTDFSKLYSDYFKANALALTQLNIVGNKAMVTYTNAIATGLG